MLLGGAVSVLLAGRGVVGDSVCCLDAPVCGGRLIVACAVCSGYAALSNVPIAARCGPLAAPGRGLKREGVAGRMCCGCCEDARVRVGLCGAGNVCSCLLMGGGC